MRNSKVKLEDFRRYDEKFVHQGVIAHLADKLIPKAHNNASEDPLEDAVIKVI